MNDDDVRKRGLSSARGCLISTLIMLPFWAGFVWAICNR